MATITLQGNEIHTAGSFPEFGSKAPDFTLTDGDLVVDTASRLATLDGRPLALTVHGDLWSGNYSFTRAGQPAIFDPAVYYGDREADLAMTELFGGFGAAFYSAYRAAWPVDGGYAVRKVLYNLYHILNHFNLFGGGYLSRAQGMMERLLSEVR